MGVSDTGATLNVDSLKAAQESGISIHKDYPDVTVHVGEGRTTRTMRMVILIIYVGTQEVSHRAYVLYTDAFGLVVGADFIVHDREVKALTLTQVYHLVVDHGYGSGEVPLGRCSREPYHLHLSETLGSEEHRMCTMFKNENYKLDPEILQSVLGTATTAVA